MDALSLSGFSLLVSYLVVAVGAIAGWRAFAKKDPAAALKVTEFVKGVPDLADVELLAAKRAIDAQLKKIGI